MSHFEIMVTCYDYGRFLRQCVDSVTSQSHRDLSVIIVDDASTDDTQIIAAELAAADSRVTVLRHPVNIGHIATYNECIDRARGDYLLILSADDFLLPGAVERAAEVLDRNSDVGLAVGAWLSHRNGKASPSRVNLDLAGGVLDPATFIGRLAIANFVATATAFVRTATQKRLGPYRPDLPHSGDLELWLRFALGSRVAWIAEPQAIYRRHKSNMSRNYDMTADMIQCLQAFRPHFAEIARLPEGRALEAEIRLKLAGRAERIARHLLRRFHVLPSLRLHGIAWRERHRARAALHPVTQPRSD